MFYIFVILSVLSHNAIEGANILGLMGIPSPSHHIWGSVLINSLVELGHNVTVLSVDLPKPDETIPPNLHYIHLEKAYSVFHENTLDISSDRFSSLFLYYKYSLGICDYCLTSEGMQVLLNYPDDFKFDLVLHDYNAGPYLLGFVHKFKYPPLIGISSYLNPHTTIDYLPSHHFPAYMPHILARQVTLVNFWDRLQNTVNIIADTAYRRLIVTPKLNTCVRKHFPMDLPPLEEIARHTVLALVNSHPVINFVEPLPPNVIEVGGMQILEPKPLPKDLDEFINQSKRAAVYIAFGTNFKSENFGENQIKVFVDAMAELPEYNFLWKFNASYVKDTLPANLLIRSFFPQSDILAHPMVKAFVSHCGALSTHEAVWRGVPIVGLPICFDQYRSIHLAMRGGAAVKLNFFTLTANDLSSAIRNVIEDPKIQENAKVNALRFRDRPMKPLDTAVWWVEYILRNPNPYHLRSAAETLNIFEANSLDCLLVIWTVLVLLAYLVASIVLRIIRITWQRCQPSKQKND